MKVLNCAHDDYANFAYDNCQALKSVGVFCQSLKLVGHPFGYESQSDVVSRHHMEMKIAEADFVQLMHSFKEGLEMCKELKKERVIVWHTGTAYRQKPEEMNACFNPFVQQSIIALGEFSGLGCKNESYVVGAINTNKIQRTKRADRMLKIAHYPSNPEVKGTRIINRIMAAMSQGYSSRFNFKSSPERVNYKKQLERMAECDVYIELFAPYQDGKKYGSFGITALEAAAMGKIVITNHSTAEVYRKAYGIDTPFVVAETEEELFAKIELLLFTPLRQIRELQEDTRKWVVEHHSYEATGKRLVKILGL